MREKDENTDALGIYTFLTSETSTQEPNVYAGRKGQILKGFSNVYQEPPLGPHQRHADAPNRMGVAGDSVPDTIFDPQIQPSAMFRVFFLVRRSGVG